eukprot:768804-Hanusia_phi.AAC.1
MAGYNRMLSIHPKICEMMRFEVVISEKEGLTTACSKISKGCIFLSIIFLSCRIRSRSFRYDDDGEGVVMVLETDVEIMIDVATLSLCSDDYLTLLHSLFALSILMGTTSEKSHHVSVF